MFLRESVKAGKIKSHQISLRRRLAEGFLGSNWSRKLELHKARLLEGGEAVDASNFGDITGQLLVDRIKEKYKSPEFVGDQLCSMEQITNGNLQTNKEPWLSNVANDAGTVAPGTFYPQTTFLEQWIVHPRARSRSVRSAPSRWK